MRSGKAGEDHGGRCAAGDAGKKKGRRRWAPIGGAGVARRENGSACWAEGGAGKLLGQAQERGEVGRARGGKEERAVLAGPRGNRGAGRAELEAEFVFPISFPFLFLVLLKLKSI
jgi:hypothetical protein